jgi:hypothetical protein
LSIAGGKLQGTFELTSLADAEDMIRAVNAWKVLLKPNDDVKRPEGDKEEAAAEAALIRFATREILPRALWRARSYP